MILGLQITRAWQCGKAWGFSWVICIVLLVAFHVQVHCQVRCRFDTDILHAVQLHVIWVWEGIRGMNAHSPGRGMLPGASGRL